MAFTYKKYEESDKSKQYGTDLAQHEQNKVGDWTGGKWQESLNSAVDKVTNRKPFTYDLNGDALYQQYKANYINQGRTAMQDTIGQASALTGGYGNSYAVTAGSQAYQNSLDNLNNIVPDLYAAARSAYDNETNRLYANVDLYGNLYNQEYGEYRDKLSDWNNEYTRLYNRYNDERNYDYGLYSDAYNRAFGEYQQQVSENQFAQNLALEQARLAEQRAARNQAARISNLKAQIEALNAMLEDKNKYSEWGTQEWRYYFSEIRAESGVSAAQEEYDRLVENGYLKGEKNKEAAMYGARGLDDALKAKVKAKNPHGGGGGRI